MQHESDPSGLAPIAVEREVRSGTPGVAIVFGTGVRDEPPGLAGVTHLAEHLVIRNMGRDALFKNGTTDITTVRFTVSGSSDDCAAFMREVITAIRTIDRIEEADLAVERRVNEAEDGLRYHEPVASSAAVRFGWSGAGLMGAGTPALATITRSEVLEWVRTHFTAENSVLTVSGEVDLGGVDLRLPTDGGTAGDPDRTLRSGIETPVRVPTPVGGLLVSLVVPHSHAAALDHALTQELFHRLRVERGLCYSVEVDWNRVDQETAVLDIMLDPPPERIAEAMDEADRALRELADNGFSDTALERVRSSVRLTRSDPEAMADALLDARARDRLTGWSSDLTALLDLGAHISSGELSSVLNAALPSRVVLYDERAEFTDEAGAERIRDDALEPERSLSYAELRTRLKGLTVHRMRGLGYWAGGSAAVDGSHLMLGDVEGGSLMGLSEAALVLQEGHERVLVVAADGRRAVVAAGDWRRGGALVGKIAAAAPNSVLRRLPQSADDVG